MQAGHGTAFGYGWKDYLGGIFTALFLYEIELCGRAAGGRQKENRSYRRKK